MSETTTTGPGLPVPPKIRYRTGVGAEWRLMRVRETPIESNDGDTPEKVAAFWRSNVTTAAWFDAEKECAVVVFVNVRRKITGFSLITLGGMETCFMPVRETFRNAIIAGAAAVVLMHNHPSGDATPGEADVSATRKLVQAGTLLGVEVIDSIVMGKAAGESGRDYASLRELGYLY